MMYLVSVIKSHLFLSAAFSKIIFCFADKLGHSSHRTVDAPGAGLKQNHRNQPENGGSQHYAVKSKGKLCHSVRKPGAVVSPVPGNPEGPQEGDRHFQIPCPGKYQIGVPQHLEEHGKEENEKAIAEIFRSHPFWDILFPGEPEPSACEGK